MNCDDFINQLAGGGTLDEAAHQHAATCPACRLLSEQLDAAAEITPDLERLNALAQRLFKDVQPVRVLPSDGAMVAGLTIVFAVFAATAALPTRYLGVHALTPMQMAIYFSVILLCALAGAAVLVQEMIPGSRRRLDPKLWIGGSCVILLGTWFALFPAFDTGGFVRNGMKCLSLGSGCAVVAGFLLSRFLRRGFAVSKFKAALAAGFFSGLAGIAVLALHCPILTAPHIFVWHLSVLLLGLVGGAYLGGRPTPR